MVAIERALNFTKARREAGLSDETMRILLFLRQSGVVRRDEIATACKINVTTLPRYLGRLVESRHVIKKLGQDDRREVWFALSDNGERLVSALLKHFAWPEN